MCELEMDCNCLKINVTQLPFSHLEIRFNDVEKLECNLIFSEMCVVKSTKYSQMFSS